jgi:hypothetical protein
MNFEKLIAIHPQINSSSIKSNMFSNKVISSEQIDLKTPVVNINPPKKVFANPPLKQVLSNESTAKPKGHPVKILNNKIENVEEFNSIFDDPSNENAETSIFNTKPISKGKNNNTLNKQNHPGNLNKINHVKASNKVNFYLTA